MAHTASPALRRFVVEFRNLDTHRTTRRTVAAADKQAAIDAARAKLPARGRYIFDGAGLVMN